MSPDDADASEDTGDDSVDDLLRRVAAAPRVSVASARESLTLPARIAGRYAPVRFIASGGMGRVYEVVHLATGQHLAMKLLAPGFSAAKDMIERFKREARASARLNSLHVVRVTDADVAPELAGAPFLVMELLTGMDLARAAAEPQPSAVVVDWLSQVAEAIDQAHAHSIVHRDLKPENIFLARAEPQGAVIKVLDFGIAKLLAESAPPTSAGQILGTPRYMAPEQVSREFPVTGACDRFALGLIAYRLLSGESYHRGSPVRTLNELMRGVFEAPSLRHAALGAEFDTWFAKACDRDPERRFASAAEQVEALATALGVSLPA